MALIRCGECRKEVSDRAGSCPSCGYPLGGSGGGRDYVGGNSGRGVSSSMDDAAERFEKRIEEYKAAGYNLKKRDGDTVVMGYNPWWYIIGGILFALGGVILLLYSYIDNGELNIFSLLPTLLLLGVASCSIYIPCYKAIISLTKTGQIEETGTRVLPKK